VLWSTCLYLCFISTARHWSSVTVTSARLFPTTATSSLRTSVITHDVLPTALPQPSSRGRMACNTPMKAFWLWQLATENPVSVQDCVWYLYNLRLYSCPFSCNYSKLATTNNSTEFRWAWLGQVQTATLPQLHVGCMYLLLQVLLLVLDLQLVCSHWQSWLHS